MANLLPERVSQFLTTAFGFPEKIVIAQVATMAEGWPRQRSMRLYGVENVGLVFLTRIGGHKWSELQRSPVLSLCFVDDARSIQILARCQVDLCFAHGFPGVTRYWNMIPDEVKKIYHSSEALATPLRFSTPSEPTAELGIILAKPEAWELLCLHSEYSESEIYRYESFDDRWNEVFQTVAESYFERD